MRFGPLRHIWWWGKEYVLKWYGVACSYFVMVVIHLSQPLLDSVLRLRNNRKRDRTSSTYFLFPATKGLVRAQIAYDLRDNLKACKVHHNV